MNILEKILSITRNYRIVYRLKPELVEIVTVFHGAKLLSEV